MSDPTGPTDPTRPMPAAQQPPVEQSASTPAPPTHPASGESAAEQGAAHGQRPPAAQPESAQFAAPAGSGGAYPGPPRSAPPKGPNLWRQATSTTGGTIAVVVAGALVALLVVGILGVGAMAVVRAVAGHDGGRMEQVRQGRDGALPPGQQRRLENGPMGGGQLPGDRNGNGGGNGKGSARGNGNGNGLGDLGMGSMMGGVGALGDVQHGEFTVQDASGKAVVMTVQRGTVTAASATSVTVRSADGFTATYAVDSATRGRAGTVAKDDAVLVVAQKAGAKAVAIRAARSS